VFLSYAIVPGDAHTQSVRSLWEFLRAQGIDAQFDLAAAQQRQDGSLWMADQLRVADFILVIASPAYRERAEGRSGPAVGRGVQWEARLIRDAFYRDQHALSRFVPVVLPDQDIDGVPDFLAPAITSVYHVSDYTVAGAESLLRLLTGQPAVAQPPLGNVPTLPQRPAGTAPPRRTTPNVRNVISGSVAGRVIQAGHVDSIVLHDTGTRHVTARYVVGAGVPGWRDTFERTHRLLQERSTVGDPIGDVARYGPGVRQEFASSGSSLGWVICALDDGRTAAVPDTIWDAMHRVVLGEPFVAIGFPVTRTDEDFVLVDPGAIVVDVDGGTWGPGTLRRAEPRDAWEWEPKPDNFSREMTRAASYWAADPPLPRFCIRAIASHHVVRHSPWEIAPERRRRLVTELPHGDLAMILAQLGANRGAILQPNPWTDGPYHNQPDRASYSWPLIMPNSKRALEADVMAIAVPNGTAGIVTCAELRVYNEAAFLAGIAAAGGPNYGESLLSLVEVRDLLAAAWQMATTDLLDLYAFPHGGRRWCQIPTVELRLTTEQNPLSDFIDFSPFGHPSTDDRRVMAVTIPVAPYLSNGIRRALATQALVYLGRNYGYLDADINQL
jgi:hypothetical protein